MGASIDDSPAVDDYDFVGQRDGRETVGDDHGGAPSHRLLETGFNRRLGARVNRGGCVVEDQDARVGEQRAGDRDPLALST